MFWMGSLVLLPCKFHSLFIVVLNLNRIVNAIVLWWWIILCKTWSTAYYFCQVRFEGRQCSFYLLTYNHRMDCPLWSWHSLTQRKKAKGGMKGALMKGLNPVPTLAPSLPPFLPCPAELIWQRGGGSISQFTQAGAAFCAVPSLSLALLVSPPPYTSLFCVHALVCPRLCLYVCACVHWVVVWYQVQLGGRKSKP